MDEQKTATETQVAPAETKSQPEINRDLLGYLPIDSIEAARLELNESGFALINQGEKDAPLRIEVINKKGVRVTQVSQLNGLVSRRIEITPQDDGTILEEQFLEPHYASRLSGEDEQIKRAATDMDGLMRTASGDFKPFTDYTDPHRETQFEKIQAGNYEGVKTFGFNSESIHEKTVISPDTGERKKELTIFQKIITDSNGTKVWEEKTFTANFQNGKPVEGSFKQTAAQKPFV